MKMLNEIVLLPLSASEAFKRKSKCLHVLCCMTFDGRYSPATRDITSWPYRGGQKFTS